MTLQLEKPKGAMSVNDFALWAGIGRTTAWKEIREGHLRAWPPSRSPEKADANKRTPPDYGANAATHAAAVGLSKGIHLGLDLKEVNHAAPAETVIAYCNA